MENEAEGNLFREINNIHKLVDAIFFLKEKILDEKNTLLFIDEIQAVPEAINMLRYFYEEVPWLHVIAAGSLPETLLHEKVRIPVGRVEYKVVRLVSFAEYLGAKGEKIDTLQTPAGKVFQLMNLPYFLAGNIKEYVGWMMEGGK